MSGTRPQGASRSEATSRARGSPRDWIVLGDGLLGFGLLELGLDGGAELAGVWPAVRVSGLGSVAALVQPVTSRSAPSSYQRERRTRCLAGIGVALTLQYRRRPNGLHVRRSAEFRISIASGSPTSLISATLVRPWAYNISSLGADQGDGRGTTDGADRFGAPSACGPEALEDDSNLDPAEPRSTQQLEPAPHPFLDVFAELARGLREVSGAAYVFVVDEELGGVRALIDAWNREDRESRRTSTYPVDKFGEFPPLFDFGHPALVQARQRFCDNAAGPYRISFADPQVRGEIVRVPASHKVGACGPTLSSRSHNSARSDLANVTSDHRTGTGWHPLHVAGARARRLHSDRSRDNLQVGRWEAVLEQWARDRPSAGYRRAALDPEVAALLKRDAAGLVTAVIQEDRTVRS